MKSATEQADPILDDMRGDLQGGSVADLLRDLARTRATATVTLTGPRGRAAIHVRDGRIVAVTTPAPQARLDERLAHGLVGSDDLRHVAVSVFHQEQLLDDLLDLSTWEQGSYEVSEDAAAGTGAVALAVEDAVPEVGRRRRQLQEMSGTVPGPGLAPVRTGSPRPAGLEPDEEAVLAAVDGVRDVRAIADGIGFTVYETARVLHGLALDGVVELVDRLEAAPGRREEALEVTRAPAAPEPRARDAEQPPDVAAGTEVPHTELVGDEPDEAEPEPWVSRELAEEADADDEHDRRPAPAAAPPDEDEDDLESLLAALEEALEEDPPSRRASPLDTSDEADASEVSQLLRELSRLADDEGTP